MYNKAAIIAECNTITDTRDNVTYVTVPATLNEYLIIRDEAGEIGLMYKGTSIKEIKPIENSKLYSVTFITGNKYEITLDAAVKIIAKESDLNVVIEKLANLRGNT